MREETRYRQELVHFGKLLHDYGYVAATNGNLSVRLDSRSILITPTSICKGMMRPRDLIVVDKDGHTVRGRGRVSSEIAMHLLIYSVRPDINAVVHAHPPLATGYASAGIPLNPALVCEAVLGIGAVPLAPYAPPGTVELADALRPLVTEHEAILMANHGVVTCGTDLLQAYLKMELVEHFATISLVTKLLGQEQLLSAKEVERLRERQHTSEQSAHSRNPPELRSTGPVSGASLQSGTNYRISATRHFDGKGGSMLERAKPKGMSLHVGLNQVDPIHYAGWKGELEACENDAREMETIARSQGFAAQSLLTKAATSAALLGIIERAAKELFEDDFFLLTYSGHGGQINDVSNDEPDGLDETWVLFDRQLIDDELYAAWSLFRPSVHIFVLSDSCSSRTMTKELFLEPAAYTPRLEARVRASTGANLRPRFLPPELQAKIYKERATLYDDIRKKTSRREKVNLGCSVILMSACQDNQVAMEGRKNGLFTEALLRVWNKGKFRGGYHHFRNEIASMMPPTQSPKYTIVGHRERAFEHQSPFSIVVPRAAAAA
jgi:ribulose-5-phosphate 4-epimerase/fuculose-1-phosphate aldolase